MNIIQTTFRKVSNASRQRKLDLFYSLMKPTPQTTLLDLGGLLGDTDQPNLQLLNSYPHRDKLTLINLYYPDVKHAAQSLPGLQAICGDGLRLPFADKQFDVCYCNAVIEHLFTFENQQAFANEIRRVAKSWFVTTPNRWFPFEPHMRLPGITWLPRPWQHAIGHQLSYNHVHKRYMRGENWREIRLLGRREMIALFPGSRVIRNGNLGWTPTFVAVGGEALTGAAPRNDPIKHETIKNLAA